MAMVKVKTLSPMLKARFGEHMHVVDRIVEDGEKRGLWARVVEGTVRIETREMRSGGGQEYETKGFPRKATLTRMDVEKRKAKE